MNDFEFVAVFDTADDLVEHFAGLIFVHAFLFDNVVEKLALAQKLHHQEQVFRRLDDFVQLDNVRVADEL